MYQEIERICETRDTIVSKIWYPSINNYACQKQIYLCGETSLRKCHRELNFLSFLNNNPNCIKIYETHRIESPDSPSIILITELCEYGNLLKFGEKLQMFNTNFDRYLIYYIKKSIKFLCSLQNQKISHRDIKPENLFVTSSGELKFGDFGSSTSTLAAEKFTIQGSPYYLSPELREGYNKLISGRGEARINYSPHLSDVYSLGLIFLYLVTMEPLNDNFLELELLEETIQTETEKIRIPFIKDLVRWMLKIIPNERPDFIQLQEYILANNLFHCYKCGGLDKTSGLSCEKCYRDYHFQCLNINTCENCQSIFKFICEKCGKEFSEMNECKHLLCTNCIKGNIECNICCPIEFIKNREIDLNLLPVNIKCCFCGQQCNSINNYYICHTCKIKYCIKCKRNFHQGPCVSAELGKVVFCLECEQLITEIIFEDIYFLCTKCGYRCIVCFGTISTSHSNCSLMLSRVC